MSQYNQENQNDVNVNAQDQNTNKKKKISKRLIIILGIALILIPSIIFSSIQRYKTELSLQLKDTNGESKELCYLTDDEFIEQISEDYRSIKRSVLTKGNEPSGAEGYFAEKDFPYIETKISMLSGIYICNSYLGNGSEVTYHITSEISSGNMRIIITDEMNKVLYEIPIDSEKTVTFVAENNKLYHVKFIAESAKLHVTVSRTVEGGTK